MAIRCGGLIAHVSQKKVWVEESCADDAKPLLINIMLAAIPLI